MATPSLTAERLRELLDYDPETGGFTRKIQTHPRWVVGSKSGAQHASGVWQIWADGHLYKGHRLAWLHFYGVWPDHEVDHINGDNTDNRIVNLRDVTSEVNKHNQRRGHSGSSSKLLGVSWSTAKHKWLSSIVVRRRFIHLGYFDSEDVAHQVYLNAKRKMHEGCTI